MSRSEKSLELARFTLVNVESHLCNKHLALTTLYLGYKELVYINHYHTFHERIIQTMYISHPMGMYVEREDNIFSVVFCCPLVSLSLSSTHYSYCMTFATKAFLLL